VSLTNLAHLDWLRVSVAPPPQRPHTTYQLDTDPWIDTVWAYAECEANGAYRRVGGGRYEPDGDRYGQGAFNADDISRAAVVYLRHWRATGSATSRHAAFQLLRGLTYFQHADGDRAGNVVLWMQPDGTLNHSGDPPDLPDPSDSAESPWLARTIWALGEGYAAFRDTDPAFAAFLRERFRLCLEVLRRQSLRRYDQWMQVDGATAPAWLIGDGADASGEALLGLAAFVEASGDPGARLVLEQLTRGVAAMSAGSPWSWPFGAVLPWARSRHAWHAWGGLAAAGLARSHALGRSVAARDAALADAASFTPHLLIAGGPDNAWQPFPVDRVQIAYGAHSRLESVLTAAALADRPALVGLAGVAAAWFFGNNPAGAPMYDPATGRTFDGIDVPGLVHRDSGAESTIHGLLAMLLLDSCPEVAAVAETATVHDRHTWTLVDAHPTPPSRIPARASGGRLRLSVPSDTRSALVPEVEWLTLGRAGTDQGTALLRSFAAGDRRAVATVPGAGEATVTVNDRTGRTQSHYRTSGVDIGVVVPPGGFALVRRPGRPDGVSPGSAQP
jgi:hypothetical protein